MSGVNVVAAQSEEERALNLRVKGLAENQGEDLSRLLSELFSKVGIKLSDLNVKVVGRKGITPKYKRHVVISCPTPEVKAQLLGVDDKLRGLRIGVSIIEDHTDPWSRSVFVEGLIEMEEEDEDLVTDFFIKAAVAYKDDDYDPADFEYFRDQIEGTRRLGGRFRYRPLKPRTLQIIFKTREFREEFMKLKERFKGSMFYLNDRPAPRPNRRFSDARIPRRDNRV